MQSTERSVVPLIRVDENGRSYTTLPVYYEGESEESKKGVTDTPNEWYLLIVGELAPEEMRGDDLYCVNKGEHEDGQFCDVFHVEEGLITHIQHFAHSRAWEDAASYMSTHDGIYNQTSLEERLAPFGTEWEQEQREGWGEWRGD